MTYKELVYMALDALKIHSDDSKFTEDHVIFLLNKYRAYALKQKYSKTLEEVNIKNYQVLRTPIYYYPDSSFAGNGTYMCSHTEIPSVLDIALPKVRESIFKNIEIVFVPDSRFKYVGYNKYLPNIIYSCIGKDKQLWLKGKEELVKNLESVNLYAVFSNPLEVNDYNEDTTEDLLDREFPMEDSLVPSVLELVLKDLTNGIYKPSDTSNDAQDALSDLAGFLRRNMKSQFQKQIDE